VFFGKDAKPPLALEGSLIGINLIALLTILSMFLHQLAGKKFRGFAMNQLAFVVTSRVLELQRHLLARHDDLLENFDLAEDTLVPHLHIGSRFTHGERGAGVVICIDQDERGSKQITVRYESGEVGVYDSESFSTDLTYVKSAPGFVRLAHFKAAISHCLTHEGVLTSPDVLEAVFWVLRAIDEATVDMDSADVGVQVESSANEGTKQTLKSVEPDTISLELVLFFPRKLHKT
jgi:hypothetical protein